MLNPDELRKIRENGPNKIAQELIGVQPISNNAVKLLYENSKTKEELLSNGYKPVSELGLMYIKR